MTWPVWEKRSLDQSCPFYHLKLKLRFWSGPMTPLLDWQLASLPGMWITTPTASWKERVTVSSWACNHPYSLLCCLQSHQHLCLFHDAEDQTELHPSPVCFFFLIQKMPKLHFIVFNEWPTTLLWSLNWTLLMKVLALFFHWIFKILTYVKLWAR